MTLLRPNFCWYLRICAGLGWLERFYAAAEVVEVVVPARIAPWSTQVHVEPGFCAAGGGDVPDVAHRTPSPGNSADARPAGRLAAVAASQPRASGGLQQQRGAADRIGLTT